MTTCLWCAENGYRCPIDGPPTCEGELCAHCDYLAEDES